MDIPGTTQNQYSGKRFFLNIVAGKLTQRVEETTEGAIKRINSEDRVVYEKYYDGIVGHISDVALTQGKYGEEVVISLKPNEETTVQIQLNMNTDYAKDFLKKLPNINVSEVVTLSPYSFDDKEKRKADGTPVKRTGITVTQNEVKIEKKYTPENPNGFPMPEKDAEGKFKLLGTEDFKILIIQQNKFLKEQLEKWRQSFVAPTTNTTVSSSDVTEGLPDF